jgi:hypothetical protein
MPLKEAAAVLGISKDAVRQRVRRGTLQAADKGEDGRVYVYLDASVYDVHTASPPPASEAAGEDVLHQQMQARIDDLREQLRREQDAHAEARRVILALTSRIPAIDPPAETPPDAPRTSETVREESGGAPPRSSAAGASQGGTRRPWWRRVFGGDR